MRDVSGGNALAVLLRSWIKLFQSNLYSVENTMCVGGQELTDIISNKWLTVALGLEGAFSPADPQT